MTAHKAISARVAPVQPNFQNSQEATFRRVNRDMVRKSNLSRSEKEVTLAFLNHWFQHRRDEVVHPGRNKLGKRSGASLPTVKRTLLMLREWDAIFPVAHLYGQEGKATEYTVDLVRLGVLCEATKADLQAWRKAKAGSARNNGGSNDPGCGRVKKNPRLYDCEIIPFPSIPSQGLGQ